MQNKRGISQAFSRQVAADLEIRPATVFDVFDMSRVLVSSIRGLCRADHGNDETRISSWVSNKTPGDIRGWLDGPGSLWLAVLGGRAAGVGGVTADGRVSLLYISPEAAGSGAGSALLSHLEEELRKAGHLRAELDATRTALGFYLARGWRQAGEPEKCCGTGCIPMRKALG